MKNYWHLKLSKVVIVGLTLFLPGILVSAQSTSAGDSTSAAPSPPSSSGYLFPIQSGKTALLTGTMGELRSSHFHAGLDINTPSIGYPVRATSDGYISRVSISTGGYGNALYVKHKDGRTSVYGHLDQYKGPWAEYIRKERYRRKQSDVDLYFTSTQFPVKKGDTLALSGNTGSSGGPHLHFEVRSPQEEAINPMSMGFSEIQDHTTPLVQKLALKTLDIHSRINDQFGRFEFYLSKHGEDYDFTQPILAYGRIGVEIQAYDRQENSRFKHGINLLELWADGKKVFVQSIEKINFSTSRNILAVMDYRVMESTGARFNKLYVDDGNRLPYYSGTTQRKGIDVRDKPVALEIRLIDFFGNTSSVRFTLAPSTPTESTEFLESSSHPFSAEITDNVLAFSVAACTQPEAEGTVDVYAKGTIQTLQPTYAGKGKSVFLIDLRQTLPDSIRSCNGTWKSYLKDRVLPGIKYKYYSEMMEIDFGANSLYDTLYLATDYDSVGAETFRIGTRSIPLSSSVKIAVTPLRNYNLSRNLGLYRKEGTGFSYVNSTWKNGKVYFSTLSFGEFTFRYDSIPPQIRPVSLNGAVARLYIKDELSGISYFEATINGKWLLMNYDYKTGIVFSERPDPGIPLKGDFVMKVVDQAGNESIHKQKIP